MITFGNIYIITSDFEKTISFYKQLFEKDVDGRNKTRYAQFQINGLVLAIMNGKFDMEHPDQVVSRKIDSDIYDDMNRIMSTPNCGKVVINLCTNDLKREYKRIKKLGIGTDLTEIRYVNAQMPYWYFLLKDVDGNTIEITGEYNAAKDEPINL
ncbi:MAG: VOC family protein [Lachnospiraceae bacterium]|nr:VOC family protein [Lachnospiraceae bacterium]